MTDKIEPLNMHGHANTWEEELQEVRAELETEQHWREELQFLTIDQAVIISKLRAVLDRIANDTRHQHRMHQIWAADALSETDPRLPDHYGAYERLQTALTEITELDLEGDASLADAIGIADEALHPPPTEET